MGAWNAPRPGGTHATVTRPGGTHVAAPRPGGTRWVLSPEQQPLLPVVRERRAVDFSATATLSAAVVVPPVRTAALSATGTLSILAVPLYTHPAPLSAAATLSVVSLAQQPAAAAYSTQATLAVAVHVVGSEIVVGAPLAATATLAVVSLPRHARTADLAADGALSVVSLPRFTRTADLSAAGTLSAASLPRFARGADFAADGTLSATVFVIPQRSADFAGAATLAVLSFPRHTNTAPLSADATLSAAVTTKTSWSDNFNRANGGLGADWTTFAIGAAGIVPEINSNALRNVSTTANNTNNQGFALATNASAKCLTDDMAVRGTMLAGENGLFLAPMVRCSIDGQNFVMAVITSDSASTGIWTRIAGAYVRRVTTATTAFNASDVFELRAVGNVYTLKQNPAGANTTIATWTDSGNLYTPGSTKRYGGIYHNSDRNIGGTQNWAPSADDFNVRDL